MSDLLDAMKLRIQNEFKRGTINEKKSILRNTWESLKNRNRSVNDKNTNSMGTWIVSPGMKQLIDETFPQPSYRIPNLLKVSLPKTAQKMQGASNTYNYLREVEGFSVSDALLHVVMLFNPSIPMKQEMIFEINNRRIVFNFEGQVSTGCLDYYPHFDYCCPHNREQIIKDIHSKVSNPMEEFKIWSILENQNNQRKDFIRPEHKYKFEDSYKIWEEDISEE